MTGLAPPQQTDWLQFSWKDIPPFVALIGALAIALSVARQLGFFSVLDLKLLSLLSTDDVLRNSLATVPFALFGSAFGFALAWAWQPPPQRFRAFFEAGAFRDRLLFVAATGSLVMVLAGFWPVGLGIVSCIVYIAILRLLAQKGRLGPMSFQVVYWFWMLVIMFLFGAGEAQFALRYPVSNFELSLTTGETLRVNLLKASSDTLIVMQTPSEISVVPRTQVKLLKRLDVPALHEPAWFEVERNFLKELWHDLTPR
jgi:hypothetical protein